MNWPTVEAIWTEMIDLIIERWPDAHSAELFEIAGNRERFVEYLACTHDLTWAEAEEVVEDWLLTARRTPQATSAAA